MPIYDFVCELCGPFERRRDAACAGDPLQCAACGTAARRLYGAPMVRSPGGLFSSASREVRSRMERSRTGEPVVSYAATPPGRPVKPALHDLKPGHHHHHSPKQRWLIGH